MDGTTIWFTGKSTGTVGKIAPDGRITTYVLSTVGSVPIYVRAGNDGTMWVTELVGNAIARITADGVVKEFPIPTHNSRPIAIVPEPGSDAMWFSEETGNRVGRIARDGTITEYPVPMSQPNAILAGLGFDSAKNLWVQQYLDQNNPTPANPSPSGGDYVLRIDRSVLTTAPADISRVPITYFRVPSAQTVMHRIVQGPDGNIWFTELGANKVGKVVTTVNPTTTNAGLDHILLGVPNLEDGLRAFERATGIAAKRGGKHPSRGTENALVSLGSGSYLELIAPRADADASDPFVKELRSLQHPAVMGWAVHVPDAADASARLTRAGFPTSAPQPGSRVTPSGETLRWTTFEVSQPVIATAPFFIAWDAATAHPSTTSPGGCSLVRFDVEDPQSADLTRMLTTLGVSASVRNAAQPRMTLHLRCGRREATFGR